MSQVTVDQVRGGTVCDIVSFLSFSSPALPLPVLDLRAIMDMEASSKTQSLGATPKSPGSVGSSSKQSPLPAKLSQKQRKMIAMATKEGSAECALSKSPPVIIPSKNEKAW